MLVPVPCCLSAAGLGLSGHPVPARELDLPHGRLTGRDQRPDPDGVPTFRTTRYDRGGCLLDPGDSGALPARCRARPAPAASQRPVPSTPHPHPTAGLLITRHQRRFTRFTRPACPSPVTPG